MQLYAANASQVSYFAFWGCSYIRLIQPGSVILFFTDANADRGGIPISFYPLFTKMQPLFDQLTALHGRLLRPKRIRLSYQKGKFMDNLLIIHESKRREQNDDFSG